MNIATAFLLGYALFQGRAGSQARETDVPKPVRPHTNYEEDTMTDEKRFTLHPYKADEKPGFYDDEVKALIEAGEGIAITIPVPAGKTAEETEKAIGKHKRLFQESAKRHGKTSRLVDTADQQDGSVHLDFILREQIKRTRKPKADSSPAVDDTPTEDAA
jgi:hypothetical protein